MNDTRLQPLTNTISVRLTGEEHRALQRRADQEERTLSNYVRRVVREFLNETCPDSEHEDRSA